MKPILSRLLAGLFLLLAMQAFGQTTMTTNFVVTAPAAPSPYAIGTHIEIELRVNNFTNIESMQFPITYNKDAMKFDSITDAAFSNWNAGNFVSNAGLGKVGISWDGYSNGANMPFTFPNGTAIFKLHFTVIGNGLSTVNISPTAAPPAIDVAGNGGQTIMLNYQSGGTPTITLGTGNPPPPPLVGFKIVANTIYIPQGERGCMPVTVNDFDNIVSMQWALHWDPAVLSYECVRSFNLSGLSATDFGPSPTTAATLLCGWADPSGVGVTRADGVRIADVCFKAIGAPGATTTITIDGNGFSAGSGSAEAYNSSSVDVWTQANHVNGASGVSAPVNVIVVPTPATDVTYTIDTISAGPGTQGCVAVKVKNFTAITSSEFALSYNTAQLTFVSPINFGANPLNLQASNVSHQAGVIKFLWNNANGVSVPNDAAIFSACFNVIAPVGTTSNINFTSTACPTVTGIGTAKSGGGVSMGRNNGWIKSMSQGPPSMVTNVKCNGGNTGKITLDVTSGPAPTSYAWVGPNGFTATTKDISNLVAGTYTVTVTYSAGNTVVVNPQPVTQPASPLAQTNMVNTVSCFGGSNGAINLTPAGGTAPYTYMWSNGSTVQDPANLAVDIYTVTIKDANDCTLGPVNVTVSGFSEIKLPANNPLVTNVTCVGLSNGSIEINPTGGSAPYTYKWSDNSTAKNLTNKPAGTYAVTVTDGNGCTKVFSNLSIGTPQPIVVNLDSKSDVKCANTPSGAASITVTGGTGTKTFCWSTGAGPCASVLEDASLGAGTYTVIVTDQNGCTGTLSNVAIAAPPGGIVAIDGTTTDSPCFEQASGSINANVTGGWGGFSYAWTGPISPIPGIANLQNLPGGTYTVTVTDAGQCTTTKSFVVAGSPAILEARAIQNVTCFGVDNGGVNLNLSGGNPGYQVAWSNTTLTGQSIGNLAPGSYQPTVTDAQGCTKVFAIAVVTGPSAPVNADNAVVTEATQAGGAIDLNAAGGTGDPAAWQYNWTGPNGFTATTQDISGVTVVAGAYTVTITDANGCVRVLNFEVPNANVVINTQFTTMPACDGDGSVQLTIPAVASAQMPITINWGVTGELVTSDLNPTITGLQAGIYNITVTAANGNSIVLPGVQVGQSDPASVNTNVTNPFSSVVKNGKITLNKAPGVICNLQYQWGPAPLNSTSNEVANLGQGTYFVTVTNPCSGCSSIHEFTLEYSPINISLASAAAIVHPKCSNSPTGSIDVTVQGGNPMYLFGWTGPNGFTATTENISGLFPGVYTLTVSDQDGRTATSSHTLVSQSDLDITNVNELSNYNGWQASGATMCDGVATVAITPGVGNSSVVWSNGVTGLNNNTLCGGVYSVTVTDGVGCTAVWTDELSAPPAIEANQTTVAVKCYDDCNGSARVFVEGGVEPYKVLWSTTQLDQSVFAGGFSQAVNLCGGTYTVTITDKNGVEFVYPVTVAEPAPIEVTFAPTAPRNFNACDGDMLAEVTGAALPITFLWSSDAHPTSSDVRYENLCSGELVFLSITDANGCTLNAYDTIPYPEDGCFRVSPVITPGQQDGKNDFVIITCIETASENHMEIYNRWGQLVFETDNYTNDDTNYEQNWNGLTNSGSVLAEGVYYYVLSYKYTDDLGNKREETRKGAINLLR